MRTSGSRTERAVVLQGIDNGYIAAVCFWYALTVAPLGWMFAVWPSAV